jgi:tetratricopeptide (TPR) repeat protein
MLPSEKTCLVTRELAEYDTKFKIEKYRQSELAYLETLARQLWLQIRPKKALKICNEILEKDPNNLWGMKVKACCMFEYIGDFVTASGIIEKMINLKYYDTYVIWLLVSMLIEQKASPDKVDNYMTLFRKQINYMEFALEFTLLNYYWNTLGDYERAQNLLKKLETEARGKIDPIYMKYVNEFYDKIAKLKAG